MEWLRKEARALGAPTASQARERGGVQVIAIAADDPRAALLNDVADVEEVARSHAPVHASLYRVLGASFYRVLGEM